MAFDTKDIKERARKDFKKVWLETTRLIPEKSKKDYSGGKGKSHPVQDLVQKTREVFLELGFDEIENPFFITEEDVYKQYGPEAPVILDRVYYLAGLPRPDIGLSDEKIHEIKKIASNFNVDEFKKILREYREGKIEGDNLLETMVNRLKITTEDAAHVVDLFPEFKNITPVPSKLTLRSHMTGAWFPTLAAMQGTHKLPMKLFSVGIRFRREQKMDAGHLRAHYGGSMVMMDEDMSLDAGRKLTEEILNKLGFKDIRFVQKKATSNYYAPGTEYEVYSGEIEIADIGMYSPVALANYDIKYNVFNLGFGLERMLMVKGKIKDVRELLHPQFYAVVDLSDEEIAKKIGMVDVPETEDGKKLALLIEKTAREHADDGAPVKVPVYEGPFLGKKIKVFLVEKEEGKKLLGPAALNEIYVHDGNVYGIPEDTSKLKFDVSDIKKKGVKAGVGFLTATSNLHTWWIEDKVGEGAKSDVFQIKMAKNPHDINIMISADAHRFITSKNKQISIKGPVFMAVEFEVGK